jgi:hypothetical protein
MMTAVLFFIVIPAKAGIHGRNARAPLSLTVTMDSGFRRNDVTGIGA